VLEARLAEVSKQLEESRKTVVSAADVKAVLQKVVAQEQRIKELEAKAK
jgi:hypothetical protein